MKNWYLPTLEQYVKTEDDCTPADCGYPRYKAIELDREPGEFDSFDAKTNSLTIDTIAEANAKAGPAHIEEARLTKYVEALLVKAGVPLTEGLLVQESEQQDITIEELASAVLAKREDFLATENERQKAQLEEKEK